MAWNNFIDEFIADPEEKKNVNRAMNHSLAAGISPSAALDGPTEVAEAIRTKRAFFDNLQKNKARPEYNPLAKYDEDAPPDTDPITGMTAKDHAALWYPLVKGFIDTGHSAAEGFNMGLAQFFQRLDQVGSFMGRHVAGDDEAGKGGLFRDAAAYFQNNYEGLQKLEAKFPAPVGGVSEFVGQTAGGAVPGIASFILDKVFAGPASGQAEVERRRAITQQNKNDFGDNVQTVFETPEAEAEFYTFTKSAIERGMMGAIFHGMAKAQATRPVRMATTGGLFGEQAAAQGADRDDAEYWKSVITGVIFGTAGGKGKYGMRDIADEIVKINQEMGQRGSFSIRENVKAELDQAANEPQWWAGRDWESEMKALPKKYFENDPRDFIAEGFVPITRGEADVLFKNGLDDILAHVNIKGGKETTGEEGVFIKPLRVSETLLQPEKFKEARAIYGIYKERYKGENVSAAGRDFDAGAGMRNGSDLRQAASPGVGETAPAYRQAEDKNLAIVHNLTTDNLLHAVKMGGLAVPSTAVIDVTKSRFDSFGEITLIASKEKLGPGGANKYFNADVYSPRYPDISYKLDNQASIKLNQLLEPYRAENESRIYSNTFTNGLDELTGNKAFIKYALEQTGKADFFDMSFREMKPLAEKLLADVGAQEKIFNGYTDQGNIRYLNHDLDAVVRLLKKQGIRDGEGFNYGPPSIRAKSAKQFKSVKDIQADRDNIVSTEVMEWIKDDVDNNFGDLADKVIPFMKHKQGFGDLDGFTEHIKEAIDGRNFDKIFGEKSEYYDPGVDIQAIRDFVSKLRNLPSEYFEGKIQRAVKLNEFDRAVVPYGTPMDVVGMLRDQGLEVDYYKKGNDEDRRMAVEGAARKGNERGTLLFTGLDITQTMDVLKGLKGNVQEAMPHLEALGRQAFESGKIKYKDWSNHMKAQLGDMWESFKAVMRDLFAQVQRKLKEERGSTGSGQPLDDKAIIESTFKDKETAFGTGEPQRLILTGGPAGAGKSTTIPRTGLDNFVVANSDKVGELMGGGKKTPELHERASALTKELLNKAIAEGYDTLYDSQLTNFPLADKAIQDVLANRGEVLIGFTDIDAETSIVRSDVRRIAAEEGLEKGDIRVVPPEVSVKGHNSALATFRALYEKYQGNPSVNLSMADNNIDFRPSVDVFKQEAGKLTIFNQELFDKFMKEEYIPFEKEGETRYERKNKITAEALDQEKIVNRRTILLDAKRNGESKHSADAAGLPGPKQTDEIAPEPIDDVNMLLSLAAKQDQATGPLGDNPTYEAIRQNAASIALEQVTKSAEFQKRKEAAALRRQGESDARLMPVFTAMTHIVNAGGISRAALEKDYDKHTIKELARKRPGLVSSKGKMGPDVYADQHGFESGDEMINAILDWKGVKAEGQAAAKEFERNYIDVIGRGESTDFHIKLLEAEEKILAGLLKDNAPKPALGLKKFIREETGQVRAGELLVSGYDALTAGLQKSAAAARVAYREGKVEGALRENRRQQEMLIRAKVTKEARQEVTNIIKDLKNIQRNVKTMTPGNADKIEALLESIDLTSLSTRKMLELSATREFLANNPNTELPSYVLDDLARLDKTGARDLSFDELKSLHMAVMQYAHNSELAQKIFDGRTMKDRAEVLSQVIAELPERGEKTRDLIRLKPSLMDNVKSRGEWFRKTLGIRQDSYRLIVESISGINSTVDRVLGREINKGTDTQLRYRQDSHNLFRDDLAAEGFEEGKSDKYGIKDITKWLDEHQDIKLDSGVTIQLQRGQVMALFRHALNEDNRAAIVEGGIGIKKPTPSSGLTPNDVIKFTEADIDRIIGNMKPEELAFAGRAFDNLFERQWDDLNDVFVRLNHYRASKADGVYYPKEPLPLHRGGMLAEVEEGMEAFRNYTARVGIHKGFLIERVGSKAPIYLNHIMHDATNSIEKSAAYIGLEEPMRRASALVYDKEFQLELSNRLGVDAWKEIEKGLKDIAGTGRDYSVTEEGILKLRTNTVSGIIALNPWIWLNQPAGFLLFNTYVESKYLMQGVVDTALHRADVVEAFRTNSPMLAERMFASYDRDLSKQFTQKRDVDLYGGKTSLVQKGINPTKTFDIASILPGMQGATYKALAEFESGKVSLNVKRAIDKTDEQIAAMTPEEKIIAAYEFADWCVENTQAMAGKEHQAPVQRGGTVEQIATSFGSQTNAMLNLTRRTWRQYKRTRDPEDLRTFAKATFQVFMINAAFMYGVDALRNALYGREDKTITEAVVDNAAGMVFWLRDVEKMAMSHLQQGAQGFDVKYPVTKIYTILGNMAADFRTIATARNAKQIEEAWLNLVDQIISAGALAKGLPYETPKRIVKSIFMEEPPKRKKRKEGAIDVLEDEILEDIGLED